jgi:uncharacterized membrane protein
MVILVTHAADGRVSVRQTGDHLGRKGAGWGGGVGLAVGLFAPPLLASVAVGAVGAVAGGLVGKFVDHRLEQGIHDKIGANLPPGSAGIIAVFDEAQRFAVEQALPGSPLKSVVQSDKSGVEALKGSLAEAMGKFSPDRTVLPISDRPFGRTIGRTMEKSVADWSIVAGAKAPEGAPNVLICLIDEAGFGQPDTFGGKVSTPNLTRVQRTGLTYNRFHVTALCSPTRAAMLTGRNHHRVGFGSIAKYPGPFPGSPVEIDQPEAMVILVTHAGSFNKMTFLNGVVLDADQQLALIEQYGGIDAIGGDHTAPHFASAWAHAGNTPFQWGKQMASHLRGTATRWSSPGRRSSQPMVSCARSSRTASTSPRPYSRRSGCPSRRWWTGSSRSRWTAPASCTRSRIPRPMSATPSSTSSSPARARSTGRLVGVREARPQAVGLLARDDEALHAGDL